MLVEGMAVKEMRLHLLAARPLYGGNQSSVLTLNFMSKHAQRCKEGETRC
jgi:hypothetical protein